MVGQSARHLLDTDAPCPAGQFPQLPLEPSRGLTVDAAFRSSYLKLKPRNLRSTGRATALFCSLALSLSLCVMKQVVLLLHPLPARRLGRRCCNCPHSARSSGRAAPVPGQVRRARGSTTVAIKARPAALHHPPDPPPVLHHTRGEHCPDQAEHPLVGDRRATAAISQS